jgi:hypothetical protein
VITSSSTIDRAHLQIGDHCLKASRNATKALAKKMCNGDVSPVGRGRGNYGSPGCRPFLSTAEASSIMSVSVSAARETRANPACFKTSVTRFWPAA